MAQLGITSKLEHEAGSGWTEVPHCKSLTFPALSISPYETTHLGITDYTKTYEPGLMDFNSVVGQCEYTPDVYEDLFGLKRQKIQWKLSDPEVGDPAEAAIVVNFEGFITKLEVGITPDGEMMIDFEIKVNGLPAINA
jgi:hypothetical protein